MPPAPLHVKIKVIGQEDMVGSRYWVRWRSRRKLAGCRRDERHLINMNKRLVGMQRLTVESHLQGGQDRLKLNQWRKNLSITSKVTTKLPSRLCVHGKKKGPPPPSASSARGISGVEGTGLPAEGLTTPPAVTEPSKVTKQKRNRKRKSRNERRKPRPN